MKTLHEIRGFKNAAIGTIMAWTGAANECPIGWLACDGSTQDEDDYPALKEAIGYTYGGSEASGTFQLPNLNNTGKVLYGKGSAYSSATGGGTSVTTIVNADWNIVSYPNRTVTVASSAVSGSAAGGSIYQKQAKVQPRVMSFENLPKHNHLFQGARWKVQNANSIAYNGNDDAEQGGPGPTLRISQGLSGTSRVNLAGTSNSDESNRMQREPGSHKHDAITYQVMPHNLKSGSQTLEFSPSTTNVTINNNPNLGNAAFTTTVPYQTAVYIIKAF